MSSYNYSNRDPLQVLGRARGYSKKEILQYIHRHCQFTPNLIKEIDKLPDVVLRNMGTPLARKIIKMVKEISLETYRAIQFTRTEMNNKGILFGIVLLKHKVIDNVLRYFHKRWPQCIICLYNEHTQKTGIINEKGNIKEVKLPLKCIVEKLSKERPIIPYFEDIQITGEEIFETLYESQNIKERENPKYFKSMIPNYCYKLPGMRNGIEKRYINKNKKLDDFF
ncbi:MAG: DUF4130 domain-containing protein [Promethearchaeota archaeon]